MPWADLQRLKTRCDVELRSFLGPNDRLAWRMRVVCRDGAEKKEFQTEADEIREVVAHGVDWAKRHGFISD